MVAQSLAEAEHMREALLKLKGTFVDVEKLFPDAPTQEKSK